MTRGETWLASLDPTRGSEQAGTRPVILFQSDSVVALLRTVVVIPLTTNLRWERFPFCLGLAKGEGGLASDSVALCHQIRVIDKSRLQQRLGKLSDDCMARLEEAVAVVLEM